MCSSNRNRLRGMWQPLSQRRYHGCRDAVAARRAAPTQHDSEVARAAQVDLYLGTLTFPTGSPPSRRQLMNAEPSAHGQAEEAVNSPRRETAVSTEAILSQLEKILASPGFV